MNNPTNTSRVPSANARSATSAANPRRRLRRARTARAAECTFGVAFLSIVDSLSMPSCDSGGAESPDATFTRREFLDHPPDHARHGHHQQLRDAVPGLDGKRHTAAVPA